MTPEHSDETSDGLTIPFMDFVMHFVLTLNYVSDGLFFPPDGTSVTSHSNSASVPVVFPSL